MTSSCFSVMSGLLLPNLQTCGQASRRFHSAAFVPLLPQILAASGPPHPSHADARQSIRPLSELNTGTRRTHSRAPDYEPEPDRYGSPAPKTAHGHTLTVLSADALAKVSSPLGLKASAVIAALWPLNVCLSFHPCQHTERLVQGWTSHTGKPKRQTGQQLRHVRWSNRGASHSVSSHASTHMSL